MTLATLTKPEVVQLDPKLKDHLALEEATNLFVMHTVRGRIKNEKPDQNAYTVNQRAMRMAACNILATLFKHPFVAIQNVVPVTYEVKQDQTGVKSMTFRYNGGSFHTDYKFVF